MREPIQAYAELTTGQIRTKVYNLKEQFETAKENHEYEYASMLLDEIRSYHQELDRRRAW